MNVLILWSFQFSIFNNYAVLETDVLVIKVNVHVILFDYFIREQTQQVNIVNMPLWASWPVFRNV